MRIPQIGDNVLLVVAADPTAPLFRPAKITGVVGYALDTAVANLMVTLDGPNDQMRSTVMGQEMAHQDGMFIFLPSVSLDAKKALLTWHYAPIFYSICEGIRVNHEIRHGREIIRAGALGIWDETQNTITFNRNDIAGLGIDLPPSYDARLFMNDHAARLEIPSNLTWTVEDVASDGTEMPDESTLFKMDIFRRMVDERYNYEREHGRPPTMMSGSLRKAQELQDQRDNDGKSLTGEKTNTRQIEEPTRRKMQIEDRPQGTSRGTRQLQEQASH